MATITKKDLIDKIAEQAGCKRVDAKKVLQLFLDEMITELGRGNRLEFRDFGVFETKDRAPRTAQNPKTLERVAVPAKRTVKFKVGRLLKERLDAGVVGGGVGGKIGKPEIVVKADITLPGVVGRASGKAGTRAEKH